MSWIIENIVTHRTEVTQVLRNFLKFDEQFRKIRKTKIACELCRKKFEDGEYFDLAMTSKGNKIICTSCTDIAESHGVKVTVRPKVTESTE